MEEVLQVICSLVMYMQSTFSQRLPISILQCDMEQSIRNDVQESRCVPWPLDKKNLQVEGCRQYIGNTASKKYDRWPGLKSGLQGEGGDADNVLLTHSPGRVWEAEVGSCWAIPT